MTEETKPRNIGDQIKSFGEFTGALPLLAALAVAASFLHERYYFKELNYPTSILSVSDYLILSLSWLPPIIFFGLLGLFLGFNIREFAEGSRTRTLGSFFSIESWWPSLIILGLYFLVFEKSGARIAGGQLLVFAIWFKFIQYFDGKYHIRGSNLWKYILFILCPLLSINAVFGGASRAYSDLRRAHPTYTLTIKDKEPTPITLLRTVERGVLYRDRVAETIAFVRWDEVKQISRAKRACDDASYFEVVREYFQDLL